MNSTGIQGVNVAALTPRRDDGRGVDLAAALDLIDHLCQSGVSGIALLGATGEFPHYNPEDRAHLVQFAVKRSSVPVIANVSHSSLDTTVWLAREVVAHGAAALLVMPPYFFRYSQESIKEFYLRLAVALGNTVPILLYNVPSFTNEISCETAVELLSTGLFAGIKDSSGRLDNFRQMKALRNRVPFKFLAGNDTVFAEARSEGADGVISGVACALPELLLGLDRAILAGASERRDRLETRLREFISRTEQFPVPVGIREATAVRGLETGPAAVPLGARAEQQLAGFRNWFRDWYPVAVKEASAG